MIRKVGIALAGLGLVVVAWAGVTIVWGDPVTSLYTRHEQHTLSRRLDTLERRWAVKVERSPSPTPAPSPELDLANRLKRSAVRFRRKLAEGEPIGRILIPRIGLHMVVVEGTSTDDLDKGPGHYNAASGAATTLPGMGGVVAIAGHRTTYAHPFRHIDELSSGDNIYLQMPYGTFRYRVYFHKIVSNTDWSILRGRSYEKLVLSACHPLYSATHRWVVFARLQGEARPHSTGRATSSRRSRS
ncbi:MAG TPA: class E sortase [Gaiellaceae bacterium]